MSGWSFRLKNLDEPISLGRQNFAIPNTIENLVREAIQNVGDQKDKDADSVIVDFEIADIEGAELKSLLGEIDFSDNFNGLEKHLVACSTLSPGEKNHDQERIKRNLEVLQSGRTRVLTITDKNTKGLSGQEFGRSGNFCKLCRNEMIPTEGEGAFKKGGAFGVGKSVLWKFSGGSTVLFSSVYRDENSDALKTRYFGRTYLPDHRILDSSTGVSERYTSGDAYWGKKSPDPSFADRTVTSSMSEDEVRVSKSSILYRPNEATGTTIVILMFDYQIDDDIEVEAIAREISDSIARNFWPMIHRKELTATVSWRSKNNSEKGSLAVTIPDALMPFVRAAESDISHISKEVLKAGEVGIAEINLRIPKRTTEIKHADIPEAPLSLRITRLTEAEERALLLMETSPKIQLTNRIALVRGPMMVVEYKSLVSGKASSHVGIIRAGLYRDFETQSRDDEMIEQFLRDSEPPAHDKWDESFPKLHSNYGRGYKSSIESIWTQAADAGKKMLRLQTSSDGTEPEGLKKKLSIRRQGNSDPDDDRAGKRRGVSFKVVKKKALNWDVDSGKIEFELTVKRVGKEKSGGAKNWLADISVFAVGESSDLKLNHLAIKNKDLRNSASLTFVGHAPEVDPSTGHTFRPGFEVNVPKSIDEIVILVEASTKRFLGVTSKRIRVDVGVSARSK